MAIASRTIAALPPLALLLACVTESQGPTYRIQARSFANSEWSAPVNVGAPINTAANEFNPALSPDELSLYFASNRPSGFGGNDLWVSRRASPDSPWETPANLGSVLNSSANESSPNLSIDGHLLFFNDDRPDGQGGIDVWMSRRADPNDDFGWGPPVNLGPDVNTAAFDGGATYLQSAEDGVANLYFGRGPSGNDQNIYYAAVTRDGETHAPAVLVLELSDLTVGVNDAHASVRTDGREVCFYSTRAGGLGGSDLWTATRRSVRDPWSTPVNLGAPMNTAATESQPTLSFDGRTLVFTSTRPGGVGGQDIWMSTRTPSGKEVP